MEGNLFNSGFLGSKFLWWIGQVADDRTWRENQSSKKIEDPKEDQPAWGYRYKVRIMGCHDQDESTLESDFNLFIVIGSALIISVYPDFVVTI